MKVSKRRGVCENGFASLCMYIITEKKLKINRVFIKNV